MYYFCIAPYEDSHYGNGQIMEHDNCCGDLFRGDEKIGMQP